MLEIPSITAINLRELDEDLFKDDHLSTEETPRNNSFVVSGALADGTAMVANDMHLTLRVPNLWFYSCPIYSSTNSSEEPYDITGISLPGVPSILIGSNYHVAWNFTKS